MIALKLRIFVRIVIAIPFPDKLSINQHDIGESFRQQRQPIINRTMLEDSDVESSIVDENFPTSYGIQDVRIDLAEAGSKLDLVITDTVNSCCLSFDGFGGTDESI